MKIIRSLGFSRTVENAPDPTEALSSARGGSRDVLCWSGDRSLDLLPPFSSCRILKDLNRVTLSINIIRLVRDIPDPLGPSRP